MTLRNNSRPPVESPPVVAPPVAHPSGNRVPHNSNSHGPSTIDRLIRHLCVGGCCLILGLLVGQSSWFRPDPMVAKAIADAKEMIRLVGAERVRPSENGTAIPLQPEPTRSDFVPPVTRSNETFARDLEPVYTSLEAETGFVTSSSADESIGFLRSQLDAIANNESIDPEPYESRHRSNDDLKPADSQASQSVTQSAEIEAADVAPAEVKLAEDKAAPKPDIEARGQKPWSPVVTASLLPATAARVPESAVQGTECESGTCPTMESHGTNLKWADTPADAYRMAEEQDKLVFLIHVSGNFEIPGFT